MCLAVPGKIILMDDQGKSPRMAKADIGGVVREICIDWLPDLTLNEYVIIHAGYALNRINEQEAEEQITAILKAEKIINKNINR